MFKRLLAVITFLILISLIYWEGQNLPLTATVLTPFLIFPLFYLASSPNPRALFFCLSVAALTLGVHLYEHFSLTDIILGIGVLLLLGGLIIYQRLWRRRIQDESGMEKKSFEDLESLKVKYATRLESLHRLEKQVSSLMELFEVARDFSEALSYEEMAKLLRERVMPEMPFDRINFLVLKATGEEPNYLRCFTVSPKGVEETAPEFSENDALVLRKVYESKQLFKQEKTLSQNEESVPEKWIFPLNIEKEVAAMMVVEGGQPEDFVRFEVLMAHLVLQVKKIRLYETVRELAIIDGLTSVYVRRHFLERFREEVQRSLKFGLPFSVLMLDIDHFKRYNDQFGHLVGDATLKEVALMLRNSLRKVDIVARYGGEEFVAVLPETTGEAAKEVSERIRSSIARHHFKVYDVDARVTVSIGISFFPDDIPESKRKSYYKDLEFDLIRYADRALYKAKEEGRNRVYCFRDI